MYKPNLVKFDYYTAGQRIRNLSVDEAEDVFFDLAEQYGVDQGPYKSWDQFWMGYFGM